MGKKSSSVSHSGYVKMEDTPWITQARDIADIGGKGVLDNYNKVNVFDEATRQSLDARNNEIYKRAFGNMEREYANTMNKYNARNYGQFGTLNATPSAFVTDQYNRDYQRRLDDLAYNQAVNYDALMNKELQRRYNTLDMYGNMYQYGRTPYDLDLKNWNIENTNRDLAYQSALANAQNQGGGLGGLLGGALIGAGIGSSFGKSGALGGAFGGGIGGMM